VGALYVPRPPLHGPLMKTLTGNVTAFGCGAAEVVNSDHVNCMNCSDGIVIKKTDSLAFGDFVLGTILGSAVHGSQL